ncbi:MAG: hypothetical protein Q8O24_07075 [Gallionellaceae bacterium]|nr:hypothetical protein [Gallionellaceae bacterium]
MRHILLATLLIGIIGLTGCAGQASGVLGKHLNIKGSDGSVLTDFHDPALAEGAETQSQMCRESKLTGNKFLEPVCEFALNDKGFAKVHVPGAEYPADYSIWSSPKLPAFYELKVSSANAKNLKWEVWSSPEREQGPGHSAKFTKAMGPFTAGQRIKLPFLKMHAQGIDTYLMPKVMIVAYSQTERGEKFTVETFKAQFGQ